ncbi:MAG: hypothetical protein R8G66_31485 [Cytophagales bacterium]|nr:hypothetical protein [Cytophagales bacterium]
MRHFFFLTLFCIGFTGFCQPMDLSTQLNALEFSDDKIPSNLLSSRTGIILRTSDELDRKSWKKHGKTFHGAFLQMGIDPVIYLFEQDLFANKKVNEAYLKLIDNRDVENIIILSKSAGKFEMIIASGFNSQNVFKRKAAWRAADIDTTPLLYKLGIVVKRSDIPATNFLVLSDPDYVEDISFFKGSHLATYPGVLRRQKLGVALMDSIRIDNKLPDDEKQELLAYNRKVKQFNVSLEKAFAQYPYQWEMFSFKDNDYALASGIQYVFQLVQTSGSGAKDLLNYPDHTKETQIISVTPGLIPGDVRLKRLPVETVVYKGYIYQARTDDVYVGKEWDADTDWQDAVRNFIFTLKRQFEEK